MRQAAVQGTPSVEEVSRFLARLPLPRCTAVWTSGTNWVFVLQKLLGSGSGPTTWPVFCLTGDYSLGFLAGAGYSTRPPARPGLGSSGSPSLWAAPSECLGSRGQTPSRCEVEDRPRASFWGTPILGWNGQAGPICSRGWKDRGLTSSGRFLFPGALSEPDCPLPCGDMGEGDSLDHQEGRLLDGRSLSSAAVDTPWSLEGHLSGRL